MNIDQYLLSEAIRMRRLGLLNEDICRDLEISKSALHRWLKDVQFTDVEVSLYQENIRLKMSQMKLLRPKMNKENKGVSPSVKNQSTYLKAIEMRKRGFSLTNIVEKLEVKKTTAYGWIKHIALPKDAQELGAGQNAKCESCQTTHDASWASGRFCSLACSKKRKLTKGMRRNKHYHGLTEEQILEKKKKRSEICKNAALVKAEKGRAHKEKRLSTSPWEELLVCERKERVLREQNYTCALCQIGMTWNGKVLMFDLDHINGDRKNNTRENLRCLCPNCHSQTDTYKSKNSINKRYSDEDVISALKKSTSVYNALSSLGMNLHGGNYTRVRSIIKKYDLKLPYLAL